MLNRTEKVLELGNEIENFQLCSPSDDPEVQDYVFYSYKHLAKRFVRYARNIQHKAFQDGLADIDVNGLESIYDVYELHIDLQVLIEQLKELLGSTDSIEWVEHQTEFIDSSIVRALQNVKNKQFDLSKVIKFCEEINGAFNSGYFLATALLVRALINHVPPIWGHQTFSQVVAQSSKSRKELFKPLDEIARDIADLHTHDVIRHKESLPTRRQLEMFKPNIEVLLQEIVAELQKPE